ncbi:Oligopeptide-binding protein OppA precursor [Novipirellula galeiformis]|uniref:Oligopeptide-binding protein OppA n=1 Tax=Novipirellula galeiformis TaxID=2528004 RepID=A0A5C6CF53_9BACT|nr:peptide ABC transporter substrate-binding protein [Novipirellula galeiformis]TWU22051.1 Oligopeptide-binding protein OppA precursor [Novipirellula galeiformis]
MPPEVRRAFLVVAGLVVIVAVAWASRFDATAPADFSLQNGSDPKTIDPARATGNIEGRIIFELFEGLLAMMPEGDPDPVTGLQAMTPHPGVAESYDVSDDGRTYTFHLRDDSFWTDGTPVTSHDFAWSWHRVLHPETASEYSFQLFAVPYAEQYASGVVEVGDRVEVELWDRPLDTPSESSQQNFPRGTMRYGTLREIVKPPEPTFAETVSESDREEAMLDWQQQWVYKVDVAKEDANGEVHWDADVQSQTFAVDPNSSVASAETVRCHAVMVAFGKLGGLETPDDRTFIVHLKDAVPYFPNLAGHYTLFPVNRKCVETYGSPMWTKAENIVTNGPYKLGFRRLRDRLRLIQNEDYHTVNSKGFKTVDFLSMEGQNTALNMYETGQVQWVTSPPTALLEELQSREDYITAPQLSVYFYRLNVARKPLDDVRIRRALAKAINREQIVEQVTKSGQIPAYTIVPPGLALYESADGIKANIEEAKQLLTDAGFPGGRGIPKMTLLYNTSEGHRAIAEVIQQQLLNNLNVKVELQNMEWGSFLDKTQQKDYDIARAGWIADYPDPNTFLDMWVTDGPQNNTNWSNKQFDQLIADAARESEPAKRMDLLRQAEQIWVDEMPVIPIYFYTSINMVKPNVKGFFPSAQDLHPLKLLEYRQ